MLRTSLIVCTFNRAGLLAGCLSSARNQTLAASEYEVIVVDNASADHTRQVVERQPGVRYLMCPQRGLSAARNTGAHAARAPVLTYIDDDARAHPRLLEQLLATFDAHPNAGCVGGKIELRLPPRLPGWYSKHFGGYYSEFDPAGAGVRRITDLSEYLFGANLSFRAEALERTGYFKETLGRVGGDQSGGEELDAQFRVARLGLEIYYNPDAIVEHVILPERLRRRHILNTARAAGRNWAYYERELLRERWSIRGDLRMWLGAWARVCNDENRPFARSQTVFYRAKILRKLRYLMRGF
jgi:glycosyltransferase involved in cell wall biosynthesis